MPERYHADGWRNGIDCWGYDLVTLNAANETVTDALACRTERSEGQVITLASGEVLTTTLHAETCEVAGATVRNMFWIASDGRVRQSRQWISQGTGSLTLQVLRP